MNILVWFWTLASVAGILYVTTISSAAVPIGFSLVGWCMLLLWVVIASVYRQKFLNADRLVKKAHTQNTEFMNSLVETLSFQKEEIKRLRDEKYFLTIALENFNGSGNDRKN